MTNSEPYFDDERVHALRETILRDHGGDVQRLIDIAIRETVEALGKELQSRVGQALVPHVGGSGGVYPLTPNGTPTAWWGYENAVSYTGCVNEVLDMLGVTWREGRPELHERITFAMHPAKNAEPVEMEVEASELQKWDVVTAEPQRQAGDWFVKIRRRVPRG